MAGVDGASDTDWWQVQLVQVVVGQVVLVQVVAGVNGASGGRCWWCKWWHVLMVQVILIDGRCSWCKWWQVLMVQVILTDGRCSWCWCKWWQVLMVQVILIDGRCWSWYKWYWLVAGVNGASDTDWWWLTQMKSVIQVDGEIWKLITLHRIFIIAHHWCLDTSSSIQCITQQDETTCSLFVVDDVYWMLNEWYLW